jgi:hypothetical protein
MGTRTTSIIVGALGAAVLAVGCGGGSSEPSKPFSPQVSLRAVGGTERTDKPGFVLNVKTRPGDANISSVAVTLPPVTLVDTTAVGKFCSEGDLEADDCAGKQRLGFARAFSPAYDGSLSGPVFAVTGSGRLPRLAYLLKGPIDVLLRGKIISKGGRIGASVEDLPDTALDSFELAVDGGETGYLVLSRNICGATAPAEAVFTSQEGETFKRKVPLEADCGS